MYENFDGAGPLAVRVSQVGFHDVYFEEIDASLTLPDPNKKIPGGEAEVVSGDGVMGFEGEKALKLNVDRSALNVRNVGLKIEFGDVSDKGIKAGDYVGFAYGAGSELEPVNTVDTASGAFPEMSIFNISNTNCWNVHQYKLPEGIDNG